MRVHAEIFVGAGGIGQCVCAGVSRIGWNSFGSTREWDVIKQALHTHLVSVGHLLWDRCHTVPYRKHQQVSNDGNLFLLHLKALSQGSYNNKYCGESETGVMLNRFEELWGSVITHACMLTDASQAEISYPSSRSRTLWTPEMF